MLYKKCCKPLFSIISVTILCSLTTVAQTTESINAKTEKPIARDFSADPSVHFFANAFYLYATNDQANSGNYWDSTDWRLLTSRDLKTWEDKGAFQTVKIFTWADKNAKAWAPGAAERNGQFYFYAPVGGKQIGVAVSNSPSGPFIDPIGKPLVETPRDNNAGDEPIDPMVFTDHDGQAYLYFGTRVPKVVKLKADMIHTQGEIQDVVIKGFPAAEPNKQYGEAPYLHVHKGIYYFSFSTGWPGQIVYATGKNPLGPFTYGGVIINYLPISTNHHAIIEHAGKSWIFYHNNSFPGGGDHKRSIHMSSLEYDQHGKILTVPVANSKREK